MSGTSGISPELLSRFAAAFHADEKNTIRQCAIVKKGISDAAENHQAQIDNPMLFSLELKDTGKVTDQKASGRCWLFAALNTMRCEVMRRLNLDTFELSENYLLFWDKLEKSNAFLDSMIENADEPLDGRLVSFLMEKSTRDGGQWDMYAALVDKYGCVPKSVMPETFHSSNTGVMNRLLSAKLREDTAILRDAVRGKSADVARLREEMLQDIYNFLAICLGEPPATFDFECRDKDGNFTRDAGISPPAFFAKYIGLDLADYVSVINAPTHDKSYGETYTIAYMDNVIGGHSAKYLNLPFDDLRRLALAQLADGRPVWFVCDVGQMCDREKGLLALNAFDYGCAAGLSLSFGKAGRLDYSMTDCTHAMVLIGVNLVDGKPTRWKVENSWGDKSGQDGYYVMSDDWFAEHGFQVVVSRKYLSTQQREAYERPPVVLPPWDSMRRALAEM